MRYISSVALSLCLLTACGDAPAITSSPAIQADTAPNEKSAPLPGAGATARETAMTNPNWQAVDQLPTEWGGLYTKDCMMAGPEDNRFFDIHDATSGKQYYFSYIVFPPQLQRAPKATVLVVSYTAWQNTEWPDHYLLFDDTQSFKQIEVADGRYSGLHQTLDGMPWSAFDHLETKYRTTDITRWAVDLENTEDYGTQPPCDMALAAPWRDIEFDVQSGGTLRIGDVLDY